MVPNKVLEPPRNQGRLGPESAENLLWAVAFSVSDSRPMFVPRRPMTVQVIQGQVFQAQHRGPVSWQSGVCFK